MSKPEGWEIDVESLSEDHIVQLLRDLRGSEYAGVVLDLRRELFKRAIDAGGTRDEMIKRLAHGVPRGRPLDIVARDWSPVVGVTIDEFKRIADEK